MIRQSEKTAKNHRSSREGYSKWDFFTDEEDSAEEQLKAQPQTPSDDPQFRAMEADLQRRRARKERERKEGLRKKEEGNAFFKKGKLAFAEQRYSEGIEADKCNKALWLNRALVRMKLGKWGAAIEDCTRMLEYMEWIEEGFEVSLDSAVKAFLRRAKSHWKAGNLEEARGDLDRLEGVIKGKGDRVKDLQELRDLRGKVMRDVQVKGVLEKEKSKGGTGRELVYTLFYRAVLLFHLYRDFYEFLFMYS